LLTGCYETRYRIKQLCRRTQFGILETERITAIAWALGLKAWPQKLFDEAWEEILKNDFHDTICGTGTDRVYRDTLKRYEKAELITDKIRASSVNIIARKADTATAKGQPVLVFNSLNHARHDVASVSLDVLKFQKNIENKGIFNVADDRGHRIPCQVSGDRLLFMTDIPPMGYVVCYVNSTTKKTGDTISYPLFNRDSMTLENEFVRLKLDARTGCMISMVVKSINQELLDQKKRLSNGLVIEEDVGNLWTVQKTGCEWNCNRYSAQVNLLEQGPVRTTIEITGPHKDMQRRQRISIYHGIPRIECEADIDFRGRDRRVRVDFHTNNLKKAVFETPYGATERGNGHHCAQTWVDMHGNGSGLAILNRGNPGHEVADGRLSLILFRSLSVLPAAGLARFFINNLPDIFTRFRNVIKHASQGLALSLAEWDLYPYHGLMLREWSSEGVEHRTASTGLPLGSEHIQPFLARDKPALCWERGKHKFEYALLPHSGDFRAAALPLAGLSYNTPLIAVPASRSAGSLPSRFSFLQTGGDKSVIVTTMKRAEKGGGLAVRAYDAHGGGADIALKCVRDISKCTKTNLIEKEVVHTPQVKRGRVNERLSPYEIGTFLVDFTPKS
jgi:alpha-mannosidase